MRSRNGGARIDSDMKNYLGNLIFATRARLNLTQDRYGQQFNISGPAVFKFERGYMKPSLQLWMKIAKQADLSERRAVLLWIKAGLPDGLQDHIDMGEGIRPDKKQKPSSQKMTDYAKLKGRDAILKAMKADKGLPSGIKDLVADNEVWALYKPTGAEINQLRDIFEPLGRGTGELYLDALRVLREFMTTP